MNETEEERAAREAKYSKMFAEIEAWREKERRRLAVLL